MSKHKNNLPQPRILELFLFAAFFLFMGAFSSTLNALIYSPGSKEYFHLLLNGLTGAGFWLMAIFGSLAIVNTIGHYLPLARTETNLKIHVYIFWGAIILICGLFAVLYIIPSSHETKTFMTAVVMITSGILFLFTSFFHGCVNSTLPRKKKRTVL